MGAAAHREWSRALALHVSSRSPARCDHTPQPGGQLAGGGPGLLDASRCAGVRQPTWPHPPSTRCTPHRSLYPPSQSPGPPDSPHAPPRPGEARWPLALQAAAGARQLEWVQVGWPKPPCSQDRPAAVQAPASPTSGAPRAGRAALRTSGRDRCLLLHRQNLRSRRPENERTETPKESELKMNA